jgi:UDP-glucose 4-epimerase
VIDCAQKVTGRNIPINYEPRRPGDPSRLIADDRKAREVLKWQPARNDLMRIIGSAWEWRLAHPSGYPAETESQAGN